MVTTVERFHTPFECLFIGGPLDGEVLYVVGKYHRCIDTSERWRDNATGQFSTIVYSLRNLHGQHQTYHIMLLDELPTDYMLGRLIDIYHQFHQLKKPQTPCPPPIPLQIPQVSTPHPATSSPSSST